MNWKFLNLEFGFGTIHSKNFSWFKAVVKFITDTDFDSVCSIWDDECRFYWEACLSHDLSRVWM